MNTTIDVFFPGGIAYEIACESKLTCTTDMFSFKAYLTRWLAATTMMAPYTSGAIVSVLKTSATAAALQCSGGTTGRACGVSWSKGADWDGTSGVGQQMAAMSAMFTTLVASASPPVTNHTGGTSVGNNNAGSGPTADPMAISPATEGDKVGAGIITTIILAGATGMFGWMSI